MTWDPRPTPAVTPETERYWSAAAKGQLLLGKCEACGLLFHYPRSHCPDCLGEEVSFREATGTGEIYTYSTTSQADNWPESELPLVLAYVELDEGPRMMTNVVNVDPQALSVGDRVEVTFEPVADDDIAVPVFTPV